MRSLCCLLISAAAGLAQAVPQGNVEIQFDVKCEGRDVAEVLERLEVKGNSYQMTETSKGKGFYALMGTAKRTSRGSIANGVPQPAEFADERSGRDTARAWFDHKALTVTMQYQGRKGTEEIPPNSQDRLSFLLALTLMPGRVQTLKFSIFDGKGQSRVHYDVGARERIQTPAGDFNAVKVSRRGEPGATDRAELWIASEIGLPVRLVHVEKDGKSCEHVAKRITRP
jgi:hypothetical protein